MSKKSTTRSEVNTSTQSGVRINGVALTRRRCIFYLAAFSGRDLDGQ